MIVDLSRLEISSPLVVVVVVDALMATFVVGWQLAQVVAVAAVWS